MGRNERIAPADRWKEERPASGDYDSQEWSDSEIEEESGLADLPNKSGAAVATAQKSPKMDVICPPFRTPEGRLVEFDCPPLSIPANLPSNSALAREARDGIFFVIMHATPIEMKFETRRDGRSHPPSQDSQIATYLRNHKQRDEPLVRIPDICGYLLWMPSKEPEKAPQIYRYFLVDEPDGTSHTILGSNSIEKDGSREVKEEPTVLALVQQKIVAMREKGLVSGDSAPIEHVIDAGVVPDDNSYMRVDKQRARPLLTTRRAMALACDQREKKTNSTRVPPPAPHVPAGAPPVEKKRARPESTPPPKRRFTSSEPFAVAPDFVTKACPAWVAEQGGAVSEQARSIVDRMVALAGKALPGSVACHYERMRAGVNAIRASQPDIEFASEAIYSFWVLTSVWLDRGKMDASSPFAGVCRSGADLLARYGARMRDYIPEIDRYLEDEPPQPAERTPMMLAYEMLAHFVAGCSENQ